MLEILCCLTP